MNADTHICPECAAGKCRNCDDRAWCLIEDAAVLCGCSETGHA